MVTSNTSEAVNSWFKEVRSLTWSSAFETIVDKMINCISDCKEKYKRKSDEEIVPLVKHLMGAAKVP